MTETATRTKDSVRTKTFAPRVDVYETEHDLLLFADMPGVDPNEIDLNYEKGELRLTGKVKPRSNVGHLILSEYDLGDFQRTFQIRELIDASKIEAEYKNGVLKIRLPKAEAVKPKRVEVKVQ